MIAPLFCFEGCFEMVHLCMLASRLTYRVHILFWGRDRGLRTCLPTCLPDHVFCAAEGTGDGHVIAECFLLADYGVAHPGL